MKSDIDSLMAARDLQAIIVAGGEGDNIIRQYMTNGAHITTGLVVKKRGEPPVLIANPMEIEEAAKSGLLVYTYYDLDYADLLKQMDNDRSKAEIAFWGHILRKFDVPGGKVGIYGAGELHVYIELLKRLQAAHPNYEFVGEMGVTLFDEAFKTKDADEIAKLASAAARTSAVLGLTWKYIAAHRAEGDTLFKRDGSALTIGDVKRFVRHALLDHDLQDTNMIFAQGRDGGFPHSRGEAQVALRLGQPIVFDLFPRDIDNGYFHDVTRTWCIGYAPDEVKQAYDEVMDAFDIAAELFHSGIPASQLQESVLNYFEGKGHPTLRTQPGGMSGYVHGLGHGIGLKVHERPSVSHTSKDTLEPGSIFTIEPGLYYPERGFGVRVEDTVYVDAQGQLVTLTDFQKDLVLPLS